MATRKTDAAEDAAFDQAGATIIDTSVQDEAKASFLEYAYSVITSRALPDARDGLKPVHRRILFSMAEAGLRPDHAFVKSARVVGNCFVAGAKVHTPSGLRNIEDLVAGDLVTAPDGREVRVDVAYANPAQEIVRVTFASGHYLDVTPGQLFRVVQDDYSTRWVRADRLAGHRVVGFGCARQTVPRATQRPGAPEADYAYTLGLAVAEGSPAHRSRPADRRTRISMTEPAPLDRAQRWAASAGVPTSRRLLPAGQPNWKDQELVSFAWHPDLYAAVEPRSIDKVVPAQILSNRALWIPFLAGFLDGDGYVRDGRREIVFTSISEPLVRDLQGMLADLGVRSHRWTTTPGVGRPNPEIGMTVTGLDATVLAQAIAPQIEISYKRDALLRLADVEQGALYRHGDMLPGAALFAEFSDKHLGGGWYADASTGAKFRAALDASGPEIRYGKQVATGTALLDRDFPAMRAFQDGWTDKLDRIGSPLAPRVRDLLGSSFHAVVDVSPLPELAPTYDIQVDDPEHAFVVEGYVVHNCMGSYHPHGDSAIYDAMVRLTQDFALNMTLVEGHGNFGSPNDPPAASRYTECRLAPGAMLLVGELDEGTVDYVPNYDGSLEEPSVLPAAFPNLLVNGATGIAVGMATNMIPHNFGEAVAAARLVLAKPKSTLDDLMAVIPGPDLPTGGLLLGLDEVRKAHEDGKGTVRLRARTVIEPLDGSRGRMSIVVTELPYGVGTEKIIEKVKEETAKKRLQGISDVKDLSDRRNGTRLVVECKTGVNPAALLNELFRYTPLEVSFGISNLALVDGTPRTLGLRALLDLFLAHRFDVVTRRTRHRLDKAEARRHIVDGLLIALADIDAVVKVIRASKDTQEARTSLMVKFKLTDIQTGHILDMPLRRLVNLEVEQLNKEHGALTATIAACRKILDDDKELRKVVDKELAELLEQFPTPRRTELVAGDLKEVLAVAAAASAPIQVADDPTTVLLSATGLLARTPAATEEAQAARAKRGRAKHDTIAATVDTTARGQVLLLTSKGRAIKLDVLAIPALRDAPGTVTLAGAMPAREAANLTNDETVVGLAPLAGDGPGIAVGTRGGIVKVAAYDWPTRSDEFEFITLKDGDRVVSATPIGGNEDLVFVTSDASLLRFPAANVRAQGRTGGGMAGVKLAEGAHVVAFAPADAEAAHVVTGTGVSVKVTPLSAYPTKGRATGGVRAHRFLRGEDVLVFAHVGVEPVASSSAGEPVELPDVDMRRDGSGTPLPGALVVGAAKSR
jgi:DNA gyrase/topoisomerase IV subunit A